jgi:hypothetical protein
LIALLANTPRILGRLLMFALIALLASGLRRLVLMLGVSALIALLASILIALQASAASSALTATTATLKAWQHVWAARWANSQERHGTTAWHALRVALASTASTAPTVSAVKLAGTNRVKVKVCVRYAQVGTLARQLTAPVYRCASSAPEVTMDQASFKARPDVSVARWVTRMMGLLQMAVATPHALRVALASTASTAPTVLAVKPADTKLAVARPAARNARLAISPLHPSV